MLEEKTKKFYDEVATLPREEILELIRMQDPDLIKQITRIEWVFRNKLTHLNWSSGDPVVERDFTNEELAYLVDEPFSIDKDLAKLGLSVQQQQQLHVAKDPVLWARNFLNAKPRVYQILMMRHPSLFKVLRAGRRLGKTWTMAALLLHYSYTTKNGKSLVVTPMKPQAGLIYEAIMEMAAESRVVSESIRRNVTSPQYEIVFSNGATIRFFTSGMKSGGKSDVTRGQEAHFIVLDELDYMGDDDLDALFAMMQQTSENQPDKRMIGASTPTGRRGKFWEWCTRDPYFKEFWFPSYTNPFWGKKMEEWARSMYRTENSYRHEIEADWGEDSEGVYPGKYVDYAFDNEGWEYVPGMTDAKTMYVMGVDWDKIGAGTNMVVLEVFPEDHPNLDMRGKIRVAHREEVPRGEYTLTQAVDRIVVLNQNFRFKHIYVDRGYGEVQVELLKKYGIEHPESNLHKKVKGIAFGGMVEVRDPFTMIKEKKETKPFMVDTLRQYLEQSVIMFPRQDEELYMELKSYVVARTSYNGKPVFEMSTAGVFDHAHDALILACLAITENYGDLMKPRYAKTTQAMSNEVFSPTFGLSDDPGTRQAEEEMAEEKWGGMSRAPVQFRRALTHVRRSGSRTIRRKMF